MFVEKSLVVMLLFFTIPHSRSIIPKKAYGARFLSILGKEKHWIIAGELGIDFIKATKCQVHFLFFLQQAYKLINRHALSNPSHGVL